MLYPQILPFSKFKHLAVILTFWFIPLPPLLPSHPQFPPLCFLSFCHSALPIHCPSLIFDYLFQSLFFFSFVCLFNCSIAFFCLLDICCFFNFSPPFPFYFTPFSLLGNPIEFSRNPRNATLFFTPLLNSFCWFFHLKIAAANQNEAV